LSTDALIDIKIEGKPRRKFLSKKRKLTLKRVEFGVEKYVNKTNVYCIIEFK